MPTTLTYQFVFISLIAFPFGSCKKSQEVSSQRSSDIHTTFTFTRNGMAIDWSSNTRAIVLKPLTNAAGTFYRLLGTSDSSSFSLKGALNVHIPMLSVTTGSWTSGLFVEESYFPINFQDLHNNNNYEANDAESITITSVHDGMVDGTFQLSMSNSKPNTIITDGVFTNVKIADQ